MTQKRPDAPRTAPLNTARQPSLHTPTHTPPTPPLNKAQLAALKQALERAALGLHHLPRQLVERPDGVRSAWPELARSSRWARPKSASSWRPSPAEIDQMMALLDAVMGLSASSFGHVPTVSPGRCCNIA